MDFMGNRRLKHELRDTISRAGSIDLGATIITIPERLERAEELKQMLCWELGHELCDRIAILNDEHKQGLLYNTSRAFAVHKNWCESGLTKVGMFLTDDGLFPEDFGYLVRRTHTLISSAHRSRPFAICYSDWTRFAAEAQEAGISWTVGDALYDQCYVAPSYIFDHMLRWVTVHDQIRNGEKIHSWTDYLVRALFRRMGWPVFNTAPSVVDHALADESSLGHAAVARNRSAKTPLEGSVFDIDWSRGVKSPLKRSWSVKYPDEPWVIRKRSESKADYDGIIEEIEMMKTEGVF